VHAFLSAIFVIFVPGILVRLLFSLPHHSLVLSATANNTIPPHMQYLHNAHYVFLQHSSQAQRAATKFQQTHPDIAVKLRSLCTLSAHASQVSVDTMVDVAYPTRRVHVEALREAGYALPAQSQVAFFKKTCSARVYYEIGG
jgi:hypothetical protein